MGFLSSLIKRFSSPLPESDSIDFSRYFCVFNYRQVYADLLLNASDASLIIAELFLFRSWVTQLAFCTLSSKPAIQKRIMHEVIDLSSKLGRISLAKKEGVDFERLYTAGFLPILELRWQEYHSIIAECYTEDQPFAAFQVCNAVAVHCNFQDPLKLMLLAKEYLLQINEIKEEANRRGVL